MTKDLTHVLSHIIQANQERIFLVDEASGEATSYVQLGAAAVSLASALSTYGVTQGSRVVFLMDNCPQLAKLYFACLHAGFVAVPINPALGKDFVEFIISDCAPSLVVTNSHLDSLLPSDTGNTKFLSLKKTDSFAFPPDHTAFAAQAAPFENITLSDPALIVYTSGTTSRPKGVVHSVSNLLSNGLAFAARIGLAPTNRFYNCLPMAYLGGYYNLLLIPFLAGGSVVIGRSFDAKMAISFWNSIVSYQVNTLWFVPTILAMLLELDRSAKGEKYCKQTAMTCLVGTAPLPLSLRKRFEGRYHLTLLENYGLSETLFLTTNAPDQSGGRGVGSVLQSVDITILDDSGSPVTPGAEGHVVARTSSMMLGYHNDDSCPNQNGCRRNDWYDTGDVGRIGSSGSLEITGRAKDLIIKGGINISPASIENILLEAPDILECAVVGTPHKIMGEEIAAVLRVRDTVNFEETKQDLVALAKRRLAPMHRPSYYIRAEKLPKTATGKVRKGELGCWVENQIKSESFGSKPLGFRSVSAAVDPTTFYSPSQIVSRAIEATSVRHNNTVYELQRQGADITVLSLGEAFFEIPLSDFRDLPFPDVYHYSHSRGIPELREMLAQYYNDEYDVSVDPSTEVLITAGSKIAIHMALMALVNPDDEVIIQEPAWVSYAEQVKLCHGTPVHVPYIKNVFDYEEFITNRTKVVIVNNPHNPTGRVWSLEEISHLCRLAEKYRFFVVSDEAYSDFLLEDDAFLSLGVLDKHFSHTVICNSMSKNYGMSGWRVGYLISNPKLITHILKLNQHLITCAPTILAHYLAKHFDSILRITKPQILQVVKKRNRIADFMRSIGLNALPGSATFYLFVSIEQSYLTSDEFCERLLMQHQVSVVPGRGYGKSCDSFVRVSIGTESEERIEQALLRLSELIKETTVRDRDEARAA